MHRRSIIGLGGWIMLSFSAAALGAIASIQARTFYLALTRPAWAPPASVFGPVWTILYALMAVAAWLVWKREGFSGARRALALFIVQLAANALWSWLFFAWHLGAASFAEIIVLWALILWTVVEFWRRRVLAGVLLLPYLFWVTFAAVLCFSVWRLNPTSL